MSRPKIQEVFKNFDKMTAEKKRLCKMYYIYKYPLTAEEESVYEKEMQELENKIAQMEIKRCPKCNGTATIHERHWRHRDMMNIINCDSTFVMCDTCGHKGKENSNCFSEYHNEKIRAIEDWNENRVE